jgi:hypothetical protein
LVGSNSDIQRCESSVLLNFSVDPGWYAAAGSVALYGVPKARLGHYVNVVPLCVSINHEECQHVDTEHAYLNAGHDESVLLWNDRTLDPRYDTHMTIHALMDKEPRVFAFEKIEYQEEREYGRQVYLRL